MQGRMRAAQLMGYRKFEMVETDIPQVRKGQVLVKMNKVGICGSDRGMWDNHHFFNELYKWEDFTSGEHGHEGVGTVVEVGPGVSGIKEGDQVVRITLNEDMDLKMANFDEYAVSDCAIVCNGADPEVMCFTDPVTVALNHIHHADVSPGDTVVVMGQGLLGLIVTQLLADNHVNVIATDVLNQRINYARVFGATVYNPREVDLVKEVQNLGVEVRAVIECSGADEAVDAACRIVSRSGRLVIMGATRTRITLNYTQMRIKGCYVCFPMNGVNHKDNWQTAAALLMAGAVKVKEYVNHRGKLTNIQRILENYDEEWFRVILEV